MKETIQEMNIFGDFSKKSNTTREQTLSRKQKEDSAIERLINANLSDDLVFSILMQRKEFCKIVLEIVLDVELESVDFINVQQGLTTLPGYKSVRLDVFARGVDGEIYNVEMQKSNNDNIPKRSRFYQGMMDASTLLEGQDYKSLPKSFVIFITEFDVFSKGFYKYTFENRCIECPELTLGDDSIKMFLNTKGTVRGNASDRLIKFLKYVSNSIPSNVSGDSKLNQLDDIFQKLKNDERVRSDFMNLSWVKEEGLEKGREEGEDLLKNVILFLKNNPQATYEEVREKFDCKTRTYETARELSKL